MPKMKTEKTDLSQEALWMGSILRKGSMRVLSPYDAGPFAEISRSMKKEQKEARTTDVRVVAETHHLPPEGGGDVGKERRVIENPFMTSESKRQEGKNEKKAGLPKIRSQGSLLGGSRPFGN